MCFNGTVDVRNTQSLAYIDIRIHKYGNDIDINVIQIACDVYTLYTVYTYVSVQGISKDMVFLIQFF